MSTVISLNYTPRDWQREVHAAFRAGKRFVVCATHRRGGKTKAALMQLLDAALKTTNPAALYCFVSPFRTQSKAIAWQELKATVAHLPPTAVQISEGELTVRFAHNGARIALFGADNVDSLRGLRLDGAVLDEFARMDPAAWNEAIQPALADRGGWALFISTPHGVDAFSELFFATTDKPDWAALRFDCYSTQALPADEIARLRRDMPEQAFRRELLCDFAASGDDQLISLSDVEAAARRTYRPEDFAHAARVLGVDVARFGDDRTVLFSRQGLQALPPIVLRGASTVDVAARVADEIKKQGIDACFVDGGGVGGGVVDTLRALGHNVIEVNFGAKATKPDEFVNRRTEMWVSMATWLSSGGAVPNLADLKQELATPVYSFDVQGRRVLESKDAIRKRIRAGSPDLADGLALTFAMRVADRTPPPVGTEGFDYRALGFDLHTGQNHFMFLKRREAPQQPGYGGHNPFDYLND